MKHATRHAECSMSFQLITDLDEGAAASLQDRALHFGDGLFETMRMREGKIALWEAHYDRLQRGAARLRIGCPQNDHLRAALERYRDESDDLIIKLILSRGARGRGWAWRDDMQPIVFLMHYPLKLPQEVEPIEVAVIENALPINPTLAGIKHLNRLDYILASERLAAKPEYNEALLGDRQGNLVEGIAHNLFFEMDGTLHTPLLDRCGVEGVMRQSILKKLKHAGKPVTIGRYREQDLTRAGGVVYCNSVHGIRPVVRIDDKAYPSNALANTLQALFDAD